MAAAATMAGMASSVAGVSVEERFITALGNRQTECVDAKADPKDQGLLGYMYCSIWQVLIGSCQEGKRQHRVGKEGSAAG